MKKAEKKTSTRYICLHGHFYQPPRENPWLEEIELQESASPYHDWNERIAAECYAPNAAARTVDSQGRILAIVNNYSNISFNFGPTLLSWLEAKRPEVYTSILAADQEAQHKYHGHGSAIAQCYNHIIMPLASRQDKITQIRWGLADFEKRFGRKAEGMWLPETAVDLESLELLAEHGITFTILAPRQASRIRKRGQEDWHDVSDARIDPRRAYRCPLPSGQHIDLFFYDGAVAQDCAFGSLLHNGENFANRLLGAFDEQWDDGQLVHIATDGETFGHHVSLSEMSLAYATQYLTEKGIEITIYGDFLEKHPPQYEVEIFENSSWSCITGIERWRSGQGSNTGMHPGWQQEWRGPLRTSLDNLRDKLAHLFITESQSLFKDPWDARNTYIDVILDRQPSSLQHFFQKQEKKPLEKDNCTKALKLLEMQRNAMLMFTSCGWFFDEISGIETVQIMHYANRAMQLAQELTGEDFEPSFLEELRQAPSNIKEYGNGANIYERFSQPAKIDFLRVAAHFSVSLLFHQHHKKTKLFCYEVDSQDHQTFRIGRQTLAVGKATLFSTITLDSFPVTYAVLHFGDHNIMAGVHRFNSEANDAKMKKEIIADFQKSDIPQVVRCLDRHFPQHINNIWSLFKDEQERILHQVLKPTFAEMEDAFDRIYHHHHALMNVIHQAQVTTPKVFATTVEFLINSRMKRYLSLEKPPLDQLREQIQEAVRWKTQLNITELSLIGKIRTQALMQAVANNPNNLEALTYLSDFLDLINLLPFTIDIWEAQNIYFILQKKETPTLQKQAEQGEEHAKQWLHLFEQIGAKLYFKKQ